MILLFVSIPILAMNAICWFASIDFDLETSAPKASILKTGIVKECVVYWHIELEDLGNLYTIIELLEDSLAVHLFKVQFLAPISSINHYPRTSAAKILRNYVCCGDCGEAAMICIMSRRNCVQRSPDTIKRYVFAYTSSF